MKGVVAVMMLGVIGVGIFMGFFARDTYIGKETFRTEQEYTVFKEAVSNSTVSIESIQSLASVPPIVVNFQLTVPRDEVFPYGKKNNEGRMGGYILCGVGLIGLCVILFVPCKKEEDK
jgi:hypothetical protein